MGREKSTAVWRHPPCVGYSGKSLPAHAEERCMPPRVLLPAVITAATALISSTACLEAAPARAQPSGPGPSRSWAGAPGPSPSRSFKASVVRCDRLPGSMAACVSFPMWRARHPAVGSWSRTVHLRLSGVVVIRTWRYPILHRRTPPPTARAVPPARARVTAPVGPVLLGSYPITAYSWGCGAYGRPTSSGVMPAVGIIASDVIPQGTRVLVVADSYRYVGTVLDTGQGGGGLDLFVSSCAAAYG